MMHFAYLKNTKTAFMVKGQTLSSYLESWFYIFSISKLHHPESVWWAR